jgi:hypothetical protein
MSQTGLFIFFYAGIAQLVEHQLPKLRAAGSSPVSRSVFEKIEMMKTKS